MDGPRSRRLLFLSLIIVLISALLYNSRFNLSNEQIIRSKLFPESVRQYIAMNNELLVPSSTDCSNDIYYCDQPIFLDSPYDRDIGRVQSALLATSLHHSNLLRIYGVRVIDLDHVQIVSQRFHGSLDQLRKPLPFEQLWQVMMDILNVLSWLHNQLIVHGDVYARNIFVNLRSIINETVNQTVHMGQSNHSIFTVESVVLGDLEGLFRIPSFLHIRVFKYARHRDIQQWVETFLDQLDQLNQIKDQRSDQLEAYLRNLSTESNIHVTTDDIQRQIKLL